MSFDHEGADLPMAVVKEARPPPTRPRRRTRRWPWILGGLVGVLAAAAGVWGWPEGGPDSNRPARGALPVPPPPTGPLSGMVVYLSAGHGWLLHRIDHDGVPFAWGRQRAAMHGMVEDDWTADFVAFDLAPALEAAGATVLALRERDRNPMAIISDDRSASCRMHHPEEVVVDPLTEGGSYTRVDPMGGAVWSIEVPEDGHWYAYARWGAADDLDPQAVYTVRAAGLVAEVVVDQRTHGGHWFPLVDWCLPAGTVVEIVLTGSGAGFLAADAVRVGGGTFGIVPSFDYRFRERPVWEVAMPHQLERLGAPEDLATYGCGTPVSDMRLRPRWAGWASPEGEDAVYLSLHTNASPQRSSRGLTVFAGIDSDPPTPADPESLRLAVVLERAVFEGVKQGDPGYRTHGVKLGDFSEVSPVHNRLPAALLELGFHDDAVDARRLQSPEFRRAAAAGIVTGLTEWRD